MRSNEELSCYSILTCEDGVVWVVLDLVVFPKSRQNKRQVRLIELMT